MTGKSVNIIRTNDHFFKALHTLDQHCIINCRLRLSPGEEHLLVDLLERGIPLIPSATSQLSSRSKVHQTRIFSEFMVPHSFVAYDANSLLKIISHYNLMGIAEVVAKRDRKNGGIGIHRFSTIEEVYNCASFSNLEYPFVVQPFIPHFRDIRVIIIDEYIEAYERINHANFRHNLHCGGTAVPYELSGELQELCSKVMKRGRFPYAHIDLMQIAAGDTYLSEINLRGGLRGAQIDAKNYRTLIDELHEHLLATMQKSL